MTKQIEGQISFDFMDIPDSKGIAMDDYMNKPETIDETKNTPVKQVTKNKNSTTKYTTKEASIKEVSPVEKTTPSNEKTFKEKRTRKKSSPTKSFPNYEEIYQQAANHVRERHRITIGTIMRLYRISANEANGIYQKLIYTKVIDETGRVSCIKKEL